MNGEDVRGDFEGIFEEERVGKDVRRKGGDLARM